MDFSLVGVRGGSSDPQHIERSHELCGSGDAMLPSGTVVQMERKQTQTKPAMTGQMPHAFEPIEEGDKEGQRATTNRRPATSDSSQ